MRMTSALCSEAKPSMEGLSMRPRKLSEVTVARGKLKENVAHFMSESEARGIVLKNVPGKGSLPYRGHF